MFPLATQDVPTDVAMLEEALAASFAKVFAKSPRKPIRIEESGRDGYPDLKSVEIDLSGAAIDLANPPARLEPTGKGRPGPTVQSFTIRANPILLKDSPLKLELKSRDVKFIYKRDQFERPLLMIESARDGHIHVSIGRDDLERALLHAAQAAAADHGVTIKDIQVELEQDDRDPNSVAAQIQVTAKKFVTAVIHLTGHLQLDEKLNARLSDLECRGDGVIGSMVCGFIRPHLARVSNKKFSLMAFSLDDVRLRDLDFEIDDRALSIRVSFGEA